MNTARWGCAACWDGDATSAFGRIRAFAAGMYLADDSHLIIGTRSCPRCSQVFVTVFTETIDWTDGDDPQHWTYMPITVEELGVLSGLEEAAVHGALFGIGRGRATLERDLPKGGAEDISWSTGLQSRPYG